jgi:glutamyl-tRNA reductase
MICLLGQNHRTAPVEVREQLAITPEKRGALAELLRIDPVIEESVVLSTCNRMELYAVSRDNGKGCDRMSAMLAEVHGLSVHDWERTIYTHHDHDAVRHLFRVASGLDSMVLGEGQILSQVRDAHDWAREQRIAHEVLHRVFDDAIVCGKRVRTDTTISEGAVSVAAAAVNLSRKIFDDLAEQSVLLIGAGDTGARTARHLQLFGVRDLRVTNRTRSRAETLAQELDASVVPWDHLDQHLSEVSIVVTAVHAPEPVLTRQRVQDAIKQGARRTLFVIDLAVPRNVHPDVAKIAGVFVYDVDDLQGIVLDDEEQRRAAADKAEEIVDDQVKRFVQWYHARAAVPTLNDLRAQLEELRRAEIDAVRNKIADPQDLDVIERVTRRLMNKILHSPTVELKQRVLDEDPDQQIRDFRRLFGLEPRDRR